MSRLCPYDSLYWFIFCLSDAFLPRRIMNTADSLSIPVLSRSGSLLLPRPLLGFFMSRRKGCVSAGIHTLFHFPLSIFIGFQQELKHRQIKFYEKIHDSEMLVQYFSRILN